VTLRGRRCALHRLAPMSEVTERIEAAQFALRRLAVAFGTARSRPRVHEAARAAGRALDALLVEPMSAEIGDRPVAIVPTGGLHPTPWGLLPGLAGRPVRVAPSAAALLRAARLPPADPAGAVVVAAGPGLPGAGEEARALAEQYPRARLLVGPRAGAAAVLDALDGADVAHVGAHGRLRTDNPLFSALELADGPLTVYDLERLRRAPRLVVLPACQSGITAVRAGDELMGLVSALLALGSRTVVAAAAPLHDAVTAPLMRALHVGLQQAQAPERALVSARSTVDPDDPAGWAAAASFTCFGA